MALRMTNQAESLRQAVDPSLQVGGHGVAMLRDEVAGDHERPGILLSTHAARIVPLGWWHHSRAPVIDAKPVPIGDAGNVISFGPARQRSA